jgi:DNA-binding NtrC family response regulator
MEKHTILLVDDDKEFRKALKRMFEKEGYAITAAADGHEALDTLSDNEFDLVISDLRMPNLDGIQLMGELRRQGLDTPIIFLTAFGEVESYMDLMNLGAFEYVNKPVKSRKILEIAQRAIESHTNTQSISSA